MKKPLSTLMELQATEVSVQVCAVRYCTHNYDLESFVLVKNYLKEPQNHTLLSEEIRRIIHLCQSLANRGSAIHVIKS